MAEHEIPRAIVRVDEIPALASGKPDRNAIGRLLAEALANPVAPLEEARR